MYELILGSKTSDKVNTASLNISGNWSLGSLMKKVTIIIKIERRPIEYLGIGP